MNGCTTCCIALLHQLSTFAMVFKWIFTVTELSVTVTP